LTSGGETVAPGKGVGGQTRAPCLRAQPARGASRVFDLQIVACTSSAVNDFPSTD